MGLGANPRRGQLGVLDDAGTRGVELGQNALLMRPRENARPRRQVKRPLLCAGGGASGVGLGLIRGAQRGDARGPRGMAGLKVGHGRRDTGGSGGRGQGHREERGHDLVE